MIVFRYLSRQLLQTMGAVTLVLLVVALTGRFIQYLGQAVAGELATDALFLLMFYRLPDFLLVILPLAFFLAILLVYGRMYAENEMVALLASGFSENALLRKTLGFSALVVVIVGVLALALAPSGIRKMEELLQAQKELTEVDLINAGQFQSFAGGKRVTHAEAVASDGRGERLLQGVFVATGGGSAPSILLAESARPIVEADGSRFMRLDNVIQYEGVPGRGDFTVSRSAMQAIRLPDARERELILEETTLPTRALIGQADLAKIAELQWRLSLLLLVPILTLIGVPLSRVAPRQGRYSRLVPAALLYAAYFVLLQYCRDAVATGSLAPELGLWWVHGLFVLLLLPINGMRLPSFLRNRRLADA
ncbi:MAG: LPS export ABC transporter permease LptF [Gammaproteobacteria bacterium]|nr:LPS export ABC transporter permease LptF [Gammaproteobacteria bacterium]